MMEHLHLVQIMYSDHVEQAQVVAVDTMKTLCDFQNLWQLDRAHFLMVESAFYECPNLTAILIVFPKKGHDLKTDLTALHWPALAAIIGDPFGAHVYEEVQVAYLDSFMTDPKDAIYLIDEFAPEFEKLVKRSTKIVCNVPPPKNDPEITYRTSTIP